MAACSLTHAELEAFCRLRLVSLSAWEVDVLFRIDDAAQGVWAEESSKGREAAGEVSTKDVKGVRALFHGIASRKRAR